MSKKKSEKSKKTKVKVKENNKKSSKEIKKTSLSVKEDEKKNETQKNDSKEESLKKGKGEAGSNEKGLRKFFSKVNFKKTALFIGLLFLVLLIIVPISIYLYSPLGNLTRPVFEKIPYPVAFVGEKREMISTKELLYNIKSVQRFYESQDLEKKGLRVDFTTEDGKMRLKIKEREILDKHVEDRIIAQLGNRYGIEVTTEDAQKEVDKLIKLSGSRKAVELRLAALYGWGIDDFRDKVVIYQMYTKKLLEKYAEISKDQKEYLEMEKAKDKLKEDGSNFASVVEEYSEGESSANGGELGWFPLSKVNKEVAAEIKEYEKGQISDIITSRLGFHIVQVQDVREIKRILKEDDEVNGFKKGETITEKEVKIRQIFKKGVSFVQWIKREKQKTKVSVWMKEYDWDEKSGQIIFANEKTRLLEKRVRARSKGDPSIKREYN